MDLAAVKKNISAVVNSNTDLLDESTHAPAICLMVALVPGGLGDKLDKNRLLLESKASYISSAYVLVAGSILHTFFSSAVFFHCRAGFKPMTTPASSC